MGYIFDNREMAEGEKVDIRKVSMYPENLTLVNLFGGKNKQVHLLGFFMKFFCFFEPNHSNETSDAI